MYLLDTNVVSELRLTRRADPNVLAWANKHFDQTLYLSTITVFEVELGCLRVGRRDPLQGKILRAWIDTQILTHFQGRILPIDIPIAQLCARLHVPDPKPERDAMIAATSIVHNLVIVTRNTADFEKTGAKLLNPWLPAD